MPKEHDPKTVADLLVKAWLIDMKGVTISPEGKIMDHLRESIEASMRIFYARGLRDGRSQEAKKI